MDAPLDDAHWMAEALKEAEKALTHNDVPVGSVVVRGNEILGRGHNRREVDGDPLAHAELIAIRQAAQKIRGWRLEDCVLYVTLEPCAMCAGALVNSRVDTLVYGAKDPKAGFSGSVGDIARHPRLNHRLEVREGILGDACGEILRDFFRRLRKRRSRSDL